MPPSAAKAKSSIPSGKAASTRVGPSELEAHLWEFANILGGPIDRTDFKSCIFTLLFFKRHAMRLDWHSNMIHTDLHAHV